MLNCQMLCRELGSAVMHRSSLVPSISTCNLKWVLLILNGCYVLMLFSSLYPTGHGEGMLQHWVSIPKVVGSISTVAGNIFQLVQCAYGSNRGEQHDKHHFYIERQDTKKCCKF